MSDADDTDSVTAEAEEILRIESGTDIEAEDDFIFPTLGDMAGASQFSGMSTGDIVDAIVVNSAGEATAPSTPAEAEEGNARPSRRAIGSAGGSGKGGSGSTRAEAPMRDAKAGPPSIAEWEKFFGNIVLRVATDFYLNMVFRGIDEDALTDRELERLAMTEEERREISVPFAELSNKSKFMRKHGRMIVASGDSINSIVVLAMWARRVNRIAAKYRPRVVRGNVNGSSGQGTPQANGSSSNLYGAHGGRFPPGFNGGVVAGSG